MVGFATVRGYRELPDTSPSHLRDATAGFALHDLHGYWEQLPDRFNGLAVYLDNEQWLEEPRFPDRLSRGSSWVIIDGNTSASWPTVQGGPGQVRPLRGHISSPKRRIAGPALRFQVFRRDSFTCQYCGRAAPEVELHADHRHPFSKGGLTVEENLVTACRDCNLGKGSTML